MIGKMIDLRRGFEVYSSILVGRSARGRVRLFAHPQGQEVPRIGVVPEEMFATHTPFTTNLMRAGCLGANIGDFAIKAMRLDFVGATLSDINRFLDVASYSLLVSAKVQAENGCRDLPRVFQTPILVGRNDTLSFDLELATERNFNPFLLRCVLVGDLAMDIA